MSATRGSRQQPATVRLEQKVEPEDGKGRTYWASSKKGIGFAREFNDLYYKEEANEEKHTGAFVLPDGRKAFIVNTQHPGKYHYPKTEHEKQIADDAIRKYQTDHHYAPHEHYRWREQKVREGKWKWQNRNPAQSAPAQPQHRPGQGRGGARFVVANTANVVRGSQKPVDTSQGTWTQVTGHVPSAWAQRRHHGLHPPPPAAQPQIVQSNAGMPHPHQGTRPAPQYSVVGPPVNVPVMHGFNRYVAYPTLASYQLVQTVELAQYCAKLIETMEKSKLEKTINVQYGKNIHTELNTLAKKLFSDFENSRKQFHNKTSNLNFPNLLQILNDLDEIKISKGEGIFIGGDNYDANVNKQLANFYDQITECLSEIKRDYQVDSMELQTKFQDIIHFLYSIVNDIMTLMTDNYNQKLRFEVKKSCIQSMDSFSGRAPTVMDAGTFNLSAEAYYTFRKTLDSNAQHSSLLKDPQHIILYFVYLLSRSNADKKNNYIAVLYNLVSNEQIDVAYFGMACGNLPWFLSAYQRYITEKTSVFIGVV